MQRLTEAERRVMEVLWADGPLAAGDIARRLKESEGWNRNTSYTLIKRCIEKGAIDREEPGFVCHARVNREAIRRQEAGALLNTVFGGSRELLLSSMISGADLTPEEAARLHTLIDEGVKGGR